MGRKGSSPIERVLRIPPLFQRVMAALAFAAAEALVAFRRNGLMSVAAVTTIMVTLILIGWALALTANLRHLATMVEGQVELVAYLHDGVDQAQRERIIAQLRQLPGAGRIDFVGRDQALARLQTSLGQRIPLQDIGVNNPLPDSLEVKVTQPEQIRRLGAEIKRIGGIEDVGFGVQVLDRLLAVTTLLRWGGVVATGLLAAVALIVIMNTIRLTILSRRTEIEIMQLVGAGGWFVRSPFLMEGAVAGIIGTLLAAAVLVPGYLLLFSRAQRIMPFLPIVPATELLPLLLTFLAVGGIVVGTGGSLLALRRFMHYRAASAATG